MIFKSLLHREINEERIRQLAFDKIQKRLDELNERKKKIALDDQKLKSDYEQSMLKSLQRAGAFKMPPEVLLGSIIDAVKLYQNNNKDQGVIAWHQAGKKFLAQGRPKTVETVSNHHADVE